MQQSEVLAVTPCMAAVAKGLSANLLLPAACPAGAIALSLSISVLCAEYPENFRFFVQEAVRASGPSALE